MKLTTSSSSAPHQSNMEIYLQNFKMTWAFQMTHMMFGESLQQLKIGGRMWRALHTPWMSCRTLNYLGLCRQKLKVWPRNLPYVLRGQGGSLAPQFYNLAPQFYQIALVVDFCI